MTLSKKDDFDFLLGKWQVGNKRLKERLVGSNEWIEFPARLEGGSEQLIRRYYQAVSSRRLRGDQRTDSAGFVNFGRLGQPELG